MAYEYRYFKPFAGTTEVIGEQAITQSKLAKPSVGSPEIINASVQTEDIADKAVTLAKLADDVPAIGIVDGSITESKLAIDAVSSAKIKDGAVTNSKIGISAVTKIKLASNSVGYQEIIDGSITTPKIVDGQVTKPKLASDIATYVPRRVAVPDKILTDFTWDGAVHIDGLDLSGIVPVGAKAVILNVYLHGQDMASMEFYTDSVACPSDFGLSFITSSYKFNTSHWVLPIDADRLLDYEPGVNTPQNCDVTVIGYFI